MSLLPSRLARLAAAVSLTAAAGFTAVATAPPASAAACTTSSGVTVIADFNQLGGGVPTICVADGAGKAASVLFEDAALPLTYAQRQQGFVCRVKDAPASDPCVNTSPADAFWSLWWSDGDPGSGWTYSSLGVGSLKIPAGGLVAFSWDEVEGEERPSAVATRPRPAPSPTPAPSSSPTPSTPPGTVGPGGSGSSGGSSGSSGSSGGQGGSGSANSENGTDPTPSTTASPTADGAATASPGAGPTGVPDDPRPGKPKKPQKPREADGKPTADPDNAPDATSESPDDDSSQAVGDPAAASESSVLDEPGDGLPVWTAPALIVLLFGGAGLAWWARRRGANSP